MKQKSIYQLAREQSGLTQEKASEYVNVSVDSIAAYEQGRRVPPDDIVFSMSEVYNCQFLCYQHLKSKITAKCLPDIECISISQGVLMLLKSINSVQNNTDKLLQIACDNKISDDEKEEWSKLLKLIDELQQACLSIKFCKNE